MSLALLPHIQQVENLILEQLLVSRLRHVPQEPNQGRKGKLAAEETSINAVSEVVRDLSGPGWSIVRLAGELQSRRDLEAFDQLRHLISVLIEGLKIAIGLG